MKTSTQCLQLTCETMFKLDSIPEFIENSQYRQLTPLIEGGVAWRFGSKESVRLPVTGIITNERVFGFFDRHKKLWMTIDKNGIEIAADYWWNGCSPKWYSRWFGWCGTPDYLCTRLAAMFHDAFYQFSACKHMPINRKTSDQIFRRIIQLSGSPKTAATFYAAVRVGGKWKGYCNTGESSEILA